MTSKSSKLNCKSKKFEVSKPVDIPADEPAYNVSKLFSLYDIKSETYAELICTTEAEFERFIDVAVNTHTEHDWHLYADDFVIYEYGVWDDGKILLHGQPKIFNSLSAYRKSCKHCNNLKVVDVREKFDVKQNTNLQCKSEK